jgi:hypothetical protein
MINFFDHERAQQSRLLADARVAHRTKFNSQQDQLHSEVHKSQEQTTMTPENDNYASLHIDYGNDPSRPPALAEVYPVEPYSFYENGNKSSFTSSISTTTYGSATTPTAAMVPYDADAYGVNQYSQPETRAVEDEALSKKHRRRRRRRARMAAAGVGGAIIGGIALGPLGAAAGGVGAAAATRAASKLGERRKDRRVEREQVAQQSMMGNAPIVNAVSC